MIAEPQTSVHIRWMIRRDMPEVLDIENRSFEFPWSLEYFQRCLRQRNCIGRVAEYDERVVGFMVYELHKNRLHIWNLAIHPGEIRKGFGTSMVQKLIGNLNARRSRITLPVGEKNMGAQLFFRALGFKAKCVLRQYYFDQDAYLMEYSWGLP